MCVFVYVCVCVYAREVYVYVCACTCVFHIYVPLPSYWKLLYCLARRYHIKGSSFPPSEPQYILPYPIYRMALGKFTYIQLLGYCNSERLNNNKIVVDWKLVAYCRLCYQLEECHYSFASSTITCGRDTFVMLERLHPRVDEFYRLTNIVQVSNTQTHTHIHSHMHTRKFTNKHKRRPIYAY